MANNHMGSVEHGKLIVDELAKIAEKYDLNAAVKLQFRQLDTFIHEDFLNLSFTRVVAFISWWGEFSSYSCFSSNESVSSKRESHINILGKRE